MGLFSAKYKTSVGTQIQRVIPDEGIPNFSRTGLIKAMFQDGDVVDHVLEEAVGSIAVRADRMYEYAKDNYTWGMPTGYVKDSAQGRPEVEAVLEAIEGGPVLIEYLHFGPPNTQHIGWQKLIAEHGYNQTTNNIGRLSTLYSKPVFMEDMLVVIPDSMTIEIPSGSLSQWGISPKSGYTPSRIAVIGAARSTIKNSPPVAEVEATEDYLRVHYVVAGSEGITEAATGTFDISVSEFDDNAEYFHARYVVGGVAKYWTYRSGEGTHPTLDNVYDLAPVEGGTFFPFTYFRFFRVSTIFNRDTPDYKTTKKMMNYLGLDYDTVAEAIDQNPDIADVEQAMLMFAVPANTTNQIERRYLYEFFTGVFNGAGDQFPSRAMEGILGVETGANDYTKSAVFLADKRFLMGVTNGGIYKKRFTGSFGNVGTFDSGFTFELQKQTFTDGNTGEVTIVDVEVKYHYFRKQISTGFYDEIQVVNLQTVFKIFDIYSSVADEEDDILIIPLDQSISKEYSMREREELYARSLHYIFNSRVITKVQWYKSELFQFIVQAAAMVITFLSFGSDGGSLLAAAFALGEYAIAVNLIAMGLLNYIIAVIAVKLFVKLVGIEAAFIIAIVAAAVGLAVKFDFISIAGAPFAKDLLTMATSIAKEVGESVNGLMNDLIGEADQFKIFMEEQTKTLDSAQQLLEGKNLLSPFVIFGEPPQDYFNRTVHSGNIGAIGISAISSYVDIALKLPQLDDTVGETFNV